MCTNGATPRHAPMNLETKSTTPQDWRNFSFRANSEKDRDECQNIRHKRSTTWQPAQKTRYLQPSQKLVNQVMFHFIWFFLGGSVNIQRKNINIESNCFYQRTISLVLPHNFLYSNAKLFYLKYYLKTTTSKLCHL